VFSRLNGANKFELAVSHFVPAAIFGTKINFNTEINKLGNSSSISLTQQVEKVEIICEVFTQ
jgi:hypothetical protein